MPSKMDVRNSLAVQLLPVIVGGALQKESLSAELEDRVVKSAFSIADKVLDKLDSSIEVAKRPSLVTPG